MPLRSVFRSSLTALFLGGALVCATGRAAPAAEAGPEPAPGRAPARIALLQSQDAQPFLEALEGFRRAILAARPDASIEVHALRGDAAAAGPVIEGLRSSPPAIVVTLGSIATKAAVGGLHEIPIVAGLILTQEDLGGADNVTGVLLEFAVDTELQAIQRLLPARKAVGVVYNPAENQARIDEAAAAARRRGLSLQSRKVGSPRDLPDALESLSSGVDVLWGVADDVVLTPQTAKPILLFSLRSRIPFVGLSGTWVKAGALYALDRDYADVGAQCGEIALQVMEGRPPRSIAPARPRTLVYSVNLKTARLLKIDIPDAVLRNARAVIE